MLSTPNEAIVVRRLQLVLKYLMDRLALFVEKEGAGAAPFIFSNESSEAKTAAKYLVQLDLIEDAKELTDAWVELHEWLIGPVLNETLASIVADHPEQEQMLRENAGKFPSLRTVDSSSVGITVG